MNAGKAVGGLTAMTVGTKASTGGFKLLKIAIAATGIGLLVIGIASLAAAFSSSEEGQNKMAKIMDVIGVVVGNLTDILASLGEGIIEAFENPREAIEAFVKLVKENIINRFEGLLELIPQLGKAITLLFSGDFAESATVAGNAIAKIALGVEDAVGKSAAAISGFVEQTKQEVGEAQRLADLRAKTDKLAREQLVNRSNLEASVANLRLKAKLEEEFTTTERIKFLKEANVIQERLLNTDLVIAKNRAEIQRIFNTFSKSTKENLDAQAEAEAEVGRVERDRANQARAIQRELNTLSREGAALNRKLEGQKAKELNDATKKAIALSREVADARIANLEDEEEKKTALENIRFERQKESIIAEFGITEQSKVLIEELEIKHQANLTIIEDEADEIRKAKQAEDDLTALELRVLRNEDDLQAKIDQENALRNIELENTELTAIEKQLIIAESEKKIEAIRNKARQDQFKKDVDSINELRAINQTFSNFVGSLKALALTQAGDDAEKQKKIAKDFANIEMVITIAQIAAATALAITKALPNPIAVVAVTATGAVQVATAIAQRNKIRNLGEGGEATKSGVFNGPSHNSPSGGIDYYGTDGNHVRVEGGEMWAVMNKKSTAMIQAFSGWNALGGGVDFAHAAKGGAFMQDGGVVQRFVSQPVISQANQSEDILNAVRNLPPSIVIVEDINTGQANVAQVIERAQI